MARRSGLLALLALLVISIPHTIFAEAPGSHDEKSTRGGEASSGGTRREGDGAASRALLEFLSKQFSLPQDYIDGKYAKTLPEALRIPVQNKADEVKEDAVAGVVADLFGRINEEQLKGIVTAALDRKKELEGKAEGERTPAEKEFLTMMERVLWGAQLLREGKEGFEALTGVAKREPFFTAFKNAFEPAHRAVQEQNREFYKLLEQAKKGGAEEKEKAQQELRTRFAGVPSFLEGQLKSNNDELATSLAEALSFKDEAGSHSLDLVGDDRTPYRVALGNDRSKFADTLRQGLNEFAPFQNGGFGRLSVSPERIADVRGNVFRPRADGTPPPAPPRKAGSELDRKMAAFFKKNGCVNCHGPSAGIPLFDAEGNVLDPAKIPNILDAFLEKHLKADGIMLKKMREAKAKMTPEDIDTLQKWAAEHGRPGFELNKGGAGSPPSPPPPPAPPATGKLEPPSSLEEAVAKGFLKKGALVEPAELARRIAAKDGPRPRVLNIGPMQNIKGAVQVNGLDEEKNLARLADFERTLPSKDEEVIIYCGCCAVETCPNVMNALAVLRQRGYTNVKVLNLPVDLEKDWQEKGFPLEGGG